MILRDAEFCWGKPLITMVFALFLIFLLSCDKDKGERTTSIYGRVTDQNQQPVDSIMVEVDGMRNLDSEELKYTYTDEDGNYELVLEVPEKYISINVLIPYLPIRNPKFQERYKVEKIFKNGQQTSSCCISSVGGKVQWDFELMPQ
ncbi:carboxypeptidase-like regulatory domain-containing protein [Dyadobacter sp. OTU695]|uniref:carboxypeptidase-like regulatory domain-containing protein n=1 Tax=Dyadobacter sp. OTU695 TaxID=3043860 RepID=UPI00313B347C